MAGLIERGRTRCVGCCQRHIRSAGLEKACRHQRRKSGCPYVNPCPSRHIALLVVRVSSTYRCPTAQTSDFMGVLYDSHACPSIINMNQFQLHEDHLWTHMQHASTGLLSPSLVKASQALAADQLLQILRLSIVIIVSIMVLAAPFRFLFFSPEASSALNQTCYFGTIIMQKKDHILLL
jgi:hypothetical protein